MKGTHKGIQANLTSFSMDQLIRHSHTTMAIKYYLDNIIQFHLIDNISLLKCQAMVVFCRLHTLGVSSDCTCILVGHFYSMMSLI